MIVAILVLIPYIHDTDVIILKTGILLHSLIVLTLLPVTFLSTALFVSCYSFTKQLSISLNCLYNKLKLRMLKVNLCWRLIWFDCPSLEPSDKEVFCPLKTCAMALCFLLDLLNSCWYLKNHNLAVTVEQVVEETHIHLHLWEKNYQCQERVYCDIYIFTCNYNYYSNSILHF